MIKAHGALGFDHHPIWWGIRSSEYYTFYKLGSTIFRQSLICTSFLIFLQRHFKIWFDFNCIDLDFVLIQVDQGPRFTWLSTISKENLKFKLTQVDQSKILIKAIF